MIDERSLWDVDREGTAILGRDGAVLSADDRTRLLLSSVARLQDACASEDDREALDRVLGSIASRARLTLRVHAADGPIETEWTFSVVVPVEDAAGGSTIAARWMRGPELAALHAAVRTASDRAARLGLLLEAIPDPIFLKDGLGRWIEVNEPALELFDLRGVDYRGRTDAQLSRCSPEAPALLTCVETDERTWRRGTITRHEEIVERQDGTRYLDTYKVPMFHADGTRRGLVVVGRDVTDRRRAELALEAHERHWRTILDTIQDAIVVIDADGRFEFVNPAAERSLGVERDELLGTRWTDGPFRIEDARGRSIDGHLGPFAEARERPLHGELVVVREDGTRVMVSFSATPLDEPGRPVVITAQDVTARAEVAALKSAFLRVAAHELRTPLTPLRLLVQQARARVARGERVDPRALERVERQIDRLTRLVEDLVEFVRVERGVLPIHPERLDLRAVAAATVEDFRDVSPGRTLVLVSPEHELEVIADATILELVLANLIDNALKYTEGDVEVRLSATRDSVRVAVRDQGAGIPERQRANLFSPFYRVGSDATTRHGGLGLGLALAREAIRRHGGDLHFSSALGRGSTFWFELPRAS